MQPTFKHLNDLPDSARVWVYPSTRVFTSNEAEQIAAMLDVFLFQWAAHGTKLMAKGHVLFNRFLVVMLDENQADASGCSLDKLMHFVQGLEQKFNTSFTNRMTINYLEGDEIKDVHLKNLHGILDSQTKFFNHLVSTKAELENAWIIPISGSWLERYV
ncbi:MAG: ABC transporter ATPase [Bacteroidia bacterium]